MKDEIERPTIVSLALTCLMIFCSSLISAATLFALGNGRWTVVPLVVAALAAWVGTTAVTVLKDNPKD